MKHTSFRRLWGMPLLMAVLIIFGLLAALLGTGVWHVLSWIALSVPVVVIIRYGLQ
jgi:hypothetical protein